MLNSISVKPMTQVIFPTKNYSEILFTELGKNSQVHKPQSVCT